MKKIRRMIICCILLSFFTRGVHAEESVQHNQLQALTDEVAQLYLHPRADTFMNSYFTMESIQHLRQVFHAVSTADFTQITEAEASQLETDLRAAINGLTPLLVARGESTSADVSVNFRDRASTQNTRVISRFPYGTPFEIIETVFGEDVLSEDGSTSNVWFRIRHNNEIGFVHGRYVRQVWLSADRVNLLAQIGLAETRLRSYIEGWNDTYSEATLRHLRRIMSAATGGRPSDWQFSLDYSQLEEMRAALSIDDVVFVTARRQSLVDAIVDNFTTIENNVAGIGPNKMDQYDSDSWSQMAQLLTTYSFIKESGWEVDLTHDELAAIGGSLRAGLEGLRPLPAVENEDAGLLEEIVKSQSLPLIPIIAFSISGVAIITLIFVVIKRKNDYYQ